MHLIYFTNLLFSLLRGEVSCLYLILEKKALYFSTFIMRILPVFIANKVFYVFVLKLSLVYRRRKVTEWNGCVRGLLKHYWLKRTHFGHGHFLLCIYLNCPCSFKTCGSLHTHLCIAHKSEQSEDQGDVTHALKTLKIIFNTSMVWFFFCFCFF